jgi:hypothetical protein
MTTTPTRHTRGGPTFVGIASVIVYVVWGSTYLAIRIKETHP